MSTDAYCNQHAYPQPDCEDCREEIETAPAALSTPTATSPRETSGEPETATASPAQFEEAVGELILAVMQEGWQPSAAVIAARQALLSLFSKAAGAPTRAAGETVEGGRGRVTNNSSGWVSISLRADWPVGTWVRVAADPNAALNHPSAGGPPQ